MLARAWGFESLQPHWPLVRIRVDAQGDPEAGPASPGGNGLRELWKRPAPENLNDRFTRFDCRADSADNALASCAEVIQPAETALSSRFLSAAVSADFSPDTDLPGIADAIVANDLPAARSERSVEALIPR